MSFLRWRRSPLLAILVVVALVLAGCVVEEPRDAGDGGDDDDDGSTDFGTGGDAGDGHDSPPEVRQDSKGTFIGGEVYAEEGVAPPGFSIRFKEVPLDVTPSSATHFAFVPGSSDVLVLEKPGLVRHYRLADGSGTQVGSFTLADVFSEDECALSTVAFDPHFAENGFVYFGHCPDAKSVQITRVTWDPANYEDGATVSGAVVFFEEDPKSWYPWHNVGSMGFEEGGVMWVFLGEKDHRENSQDLSNALGSLIRIVPNRDADGEGHESAPDNPFVGEEGKDPDVYAYGMRSPWRGLRDHAGRYWIGDVGAEAREEIHVITSPGENLGWPVWEGKCLVDCDGFSDPLRAWNHSFEHPFVPDPDRKTLGGWVGYVGIEYPPGGEDPYGDRLDGVVLYGEMCQGWIRGITLDGSGTVATDGHVGFLEGPAGWEVGPDGHVYVVTFGQCVPVDGPTTAGLYRLVVEDA